MDARVLDNDSTACNYITLENLDSDVRNLIKECVEARKLAYCPYSKFQVGASVLCDKGTVYTGCNVENSSYGLSICAERTALVKAISSGDQDFKALAVSSSHPGDPVSPCGACRQFIMEFSRSKDIVIYLTNAKMDKIKQTTISQLLPNYFILENK